MPSESGTKNLTCDCRKMITVDCGMNGLLSGFHFEFSEGGRWARSKYTCSKVGSRLGWGDGLGRIGLGTSWKFWSNTSHCFIAFHRPSHRFTWDSVLPPIWFQGRWRTSGHGTFDNCRSNGSTYRGSVAQLLGMDNLTICTSAHESE